MVYEHLVSVMHFEMPINRVTFSDNIDQILETNDVEGLPERILACSDVTGELLFYCEWADNRRKFVAADKENTEFIRMAAEFLEHHLE